MKVLVVVDAQNDFFTGSLRNESAIEIKDNLVAKVKNALYDTDDTCVMFTKDNHKIPEYYDTEEGRSLPIEHCVEGTDGAEIIPELLPFVPRINTDRVKVFMKDTYTCYNLFLFLVLESLAENFKIDEIEFVGVCTDICVISNALAARWLLPKTHIAVDASCCAGLSVDGHLSALKIMKACNIEVRTIGEDK